MGNQIAAGQELDTLFSFVDLASTFLAAAGVDTPSDDGPKFVAFMRSD